MRDFAVAVVSGLAALGLKVYDERDSPFSWGSLKHLLFPAVFGLTVFLTVDIWKATRQLIREVKVESEKEIDLYPSLVLTEKFTEKRGPSFYCLKILGMAASLILTFCLACWGSWRFGSGSKSHASELASLPPSPVSTSVSISTPSPTPSASVTATPSVVASVSPSATSTPALTPNPAPSPSASVASDEATGPSRPVYSEFLQYRSMVKMSPYTFWFMAGGENPLRLEAKIAFWYDPPVTKEKRLVVYIPRAGGWVMGVTCNYVVNSAAGWSRRILELEAAKNTELESVVNNSEPLRLVIFHEGPLYKLRADGLRERGVVVFGPEEPFERP